jgi:sigma-B regulation protein RsbU (phosphoserine phosphatase)
LADASGKGPAAALVGAMVQGLFTVEAGCGTVPGDTLTRVNRAMCRRRLEPHFVTLVYGVLSPSRVLRYSIAGHNPPILLTGRGDMRRLGTGGPILGVFENACFDEGTEQLESGIPSSCSATGSPTRCNRAGDAFGDERLLACVQRLGRPGRPGRSSTRSSEPWHSFSAGALQADDVTCLVLQVR